jgi:PST family polysaccharide transporter
MAERIGTKEKRLFNNTVMLYIMMVSTQLINLATVPYLTRVLGAISYGKIGVATSYMAFVQIIIDLGFILSATRKVAEHRNDKNYLSELFTSVTIAKCGLAFFVSIIFIAHVKVSSNLRDDYLFYVLYLASFVFNGLLPDFMYRGLENMKAITYRTVAIRSFSAALIFLFVHNSNDYCLVPIFNLFGNFIAVIVMYIHMKSKYHIYFCKVRFAAVLSHVKDSLQFFASRISGTVYQSSNTIILSYLYNGTAIIGFYAAAIKIVALVKSGSSPIADSLFPYMVQNKNFKLIKKILLIVMPIIIIAVVICAIFANQICVFLFGAEYYEAGLILFLLLPYILVIFPTYILAFPVMVPMGLAKYANFSNVFGLGLQFILIITFVLTGKLNVYTLCIATSTTEVAVFAYRLYYVLKYRERLSSGPYSKNLI